MNFSEFAVKVIVYGGFAFAVLVSGYAVSLALDYADLARRRMRFVLDLSRSLDNDLATWDRVNELASFHHLTHSQVGRAIRMLWRTELTSDVDPDLPFVKLIEEFMHLHKKALPFDGMPIEILVPLERIKKFHSEMEFLLEPLVSQLRDLLALRSKEYRRQKYYTVGGFALGILGSIFAVYSYFYPFQTV